KVRDTVSHHPAGASVDELDSKLEGLILPVFDFREMARRSLGKNWNSGSNEQRKEFVDLFTKLLSDTYLKRIREIEKSTVSYVGERVHGSRAVVKTVVTQEGQDFPIDYRMGKQGEVWRVYDVVIENISLVSNYRSEFAGIIRKDSFSGLLERLRQKRAEMVASRNEGDAA
ncbi:MAG: ABC transporter substrate-binding protein, partial [Bdellovibrionales bacterium]|nr:ABC transporter substrate-binding protein [Bdellovibrionales bacterium]